MKAKKKRKAKTWTWRGWGVMYSDGFLATMHEELAREDAANAKVATLVRVVAKVTEVRR